MQDKEQARNISWHSPITWFLLAIAALGTACFVMLLVIAPLFWLVIPGTLIAGGICAAVVIIVKELIDRAKLVWTIFMLLAMLGGTLYGIAYLFSSYYAQ